MKKFETVEELAEERNKVAAEFEGGLPEYLTKYFDESEKRLLTVEFFKQKAARTRARTEGEKGKFAAEKTEEFWEENDFELVKEKRRVGSHLEPVFTESPRNIENVHNERDLSQEEINVLISLCEKDLYLFAIRYFPHYLNKPSSAFHRYLYNTLTRYLGQKKRRKGFKLAVTAPRGNAKSSVVSAILPIWCVCYNKKRFIIIISDTAGQAADFLADIKRELEFNERLRKDFPYIAKTGPVWRADEIITANNVKILSLGTGNKIRGRRFGIYRPDAILLDDIEEKDIVRSEAKRTDLYEWFDKDVMFAGDAEGTTDFLLVGTILGKEALLNKIINTTDYPEWHSRRFCALIKEPENRDLWDQWVGIFKNRFDVDREKSASKFYQDNKDKMDVGAEVLWPEGDPLYNLMMWKYFKPSAFNAEKQNLPVDPTKVLISKDKLTLRNFYTDPEILRIIKDGQYYGALDPSLGKKGGDYSCICTIVRDPKTGVLLVVNFSLRRRSVDQQIADIIEFDKRFDYKLFAIETNAFQYVLKDNLLKEQRKLGITIPTIEINNYQDKKMRFESVVPLMLDGSIIFDSRQMGKSQEYNEAIEQITSVTGDGDERDDACVLPDTIILTDSGVRNIQDIQIGDRVLSHTGKFNEVIGVSERDYSGDIFNIRGNGTLELGITPNHPLLINSYENKYFYKKPRTYKTIPHNDFEFKTLGDVNPKNNLLNFPVISEAPQKIILDMTEFIDNYEERDGFLYSKFGTIDNPKGNAIKRFIEVDEKLAFILGYYLAEGSRSIKGCSFEFASHVREKNVDRFLIEWFKTVGIVKSFSRIQENTNAKRIAFGSKIFRNFFGLFGSSLDKKLPGFWYKLGWDETKALILGYFFGDGNFTTGQGRSNSISKNITFQIYSLLTKIGLRSNLRFISRKGRWHGFGEIIQNDQYGIDLNRTETVKLFKDAPEFITEIYKDKITKFIKLNKNIRNSSYFCDGFLSKKIHKLEKVLYVGKVYNLAVENDNSYVANGITVHNCDALEMAVRIARKRKFKLTTRSTRRE